MTLGRPPRPEPEFSPSEQESAPKLVPLRVTGPNFNDETLADLGKILGDAFEAVNTVLSSPSRTA